MAEPQFSRGRTLITDVEIHLHHGAHQESLDGSNRRGIIPGLAIGTETVS